MSIRATAPNADAISSLADGLGTEGCLIVVGVPSEPLHFSAQTLISGYRRVQGWSSGTAADSTAALAFAQLQGIEPMIEVFSLTDLQTAFDAMLHGTVHVRAVVEVPDR